MDSFKKKIKNSFDKGSVNYDNNSNLQKETLENLLDLFLCETKGHNQNFSLLELGSGTGVFSKKLSEKIFLKKIHLLDISSEMIEKSKLRFNDKKVFFFKSDFDCFKNYQDYNLIISNMSVHWSKNFMRLMKKILLSINKNSIVLISFPNSGSFRNLKKDHKKFTNYLPNINLLRDYLGSSKYYFSAKEMIHEEYFKNILVFFRSLKNIGANVSNNFFNPIDLYSLRRNKEKIKVDFDISYLFIRKIKD